MSQEATHAASVEPAAGLPTRRKPERAARVLLSCRAMLRQAVRSLLLCALLVHGAVGVTRAAVEDPSPRLTMRHIFSTISTLFPASLAEESCRDPSQRSKIMAELRNLAESSAALNVHAGSRDPTFRHLSRSMGLDVLETQRSYSSERFEEARFYLLEMIQNCIACHSRLPGTGDFSLAEELTASVEIAKLQRRERVNLQFASRRFEAALTTWEEAFADLGVSPLDLDISGELTDYLTLCLRVKRDPERALFGLAKLSARTDLPRYLRGRFRAWSSALEELRESQREPSKTADAPSLARARQLLTRAHAARGFPHPHEQLIFDLGASSELYQLLYTQPKPGPDLAEAYFLLGAIETRSADSHWVPQAEFHLESAVRLAPQGPFAEPAYELLEEYSVANYGGTAGEWVPVDVRTRLEELLELLEGGQERGPR